MIREYEFEFDFFSF